METIADVLVEVKSAITQPEASQAGLMQADPNPAVSSTGTEANDSEVSGLDVMSSSPQSDDSKLNEAQNIVLNLVDFAPTPLERIVEQSQLPIDQISSILLQLELSGYLAPYAGGQYQRIQ